MVRTETKFLDICWVIGYSWPAWATLVWLDLVLLEQSYREGVQAVDVVNKKTLLSYYLHIYIYII